MYTLDMLYLLDEENEAVPLERVFRVRLMPFGAHNEKNTFYNNNIYKWSYMMQ